MPVSGSLLPTSGGSRVPVRVTNNQIVAEESYLVRNNHKAPTCYTHGSPINGELYKWSGKGDPDQNDVLAVPGYVVRSPQFQRQLSRNLLSLVYEGETNPLEQQAEMWQDQQQSQLDDIQGSLEREADLTLNEVHCVAPQGGKPCNEQMFLRGEDMTTRPPLCDRHLEQYGQYFFYDEKAQEWKRLPPPPKDKKD